MIEVHCTGREGSTAINTWGILLLVQPKFHVFSSLFVLLKVGGFVFLIVIFMIDALTFFAEWLELRFPLEIEL